MGKLLSDAKIHAQYENFRIENITIEERNDYFVGTIEVAFPNANHPDFDDSVCDNWISYDSDGKRIAFDNWYPEDIYLKLCDAIRKKRAA